MNSMVVQQSGPGKSQRRVRPGLGLETYRTSVKRTGMLVARTPNTGSRGHSKFSRSWIHLDILHLCSLDSLRRTIEHTRLRVVRLRTSSLSASRTEAMSRDINMKVEWIFGSTRSFPDLGAELLGF